MAQFINAVNKNANFIYLYHYDSVTEILSERIKSIPINRFSHDLIKSADDSDTKTLILKDGSENVCTMTISDEANLLPFNWYLFPNEILDTTVTEVYPLLNFFLLP